MVASLCVRSSVVVCSFLCARRILGLCLCALLLILLLPEHMFVFLRTATSAFWCGAAVYCAATKFNVHVIGVLGVRDLVTLLKR